MLFINRDDVHRHLTYGACIEIVRDAMIQFSLGNTRQLLRSILPLGDGQMFGAMLGGLDDKEVFGAKLVSVYPQNFALGKPSHQGVIVLFESLGGAPTCVIDAGSITAIRTAAASAAATNELALPDASSLALLGYGEQAVAHARAIQEIRNLTSIRIWGRTRERAESCAERIEQETGVETSAVSDARSAVEAASIVCTVTASPSPILKGEWIAPGAHINLVGSSHAGATEVDTELVRRARYIVDSRESVMAQGAEFLIAKKEGAVNDDHIVGEIGEVFAGRLVPRYNPRDITVYKSLGHVTQDLATAAFVFDSYCRP